MHIAVEEGNTGADRQLNTLINFKYFYHNNKIL